MIQDYNDHDVVYGVMMNFKKHLACVKEGYFVRIDKFGIWCSKEEPEQADGKQ